MMDSDFNKLYLEPLTHREMDILHLLANGLSNQEIADQLVVELSTVKWFNSQIFSKLQVKNRKQAVLRARTEGILESNKQLDEQIKHNLPADTIPFIGRRNEIKELLEQLTNSDYRLITILAPGGMGKSRLAIEVGRQALTHFRDGVYFISLAAVTSTTQIVTTIADVIDYQFPNDTQPQQQLLEHIQELHMLLIIDNFEHLLTSSTLLIDILKAAAHVKLLVTSREKLELSAEAVYVISGLSTAANEKIDVSKSDAVKLFLEAANRISAPIQNNTDMEIIARICKMLGGMPLAILLASAWLDTLSLTEIELELKHGLGILESNLRDLPYRHHSIESVFDYSWKRLTEHEKMVFRHLSVFRGGFTREAATALTEANIHDLQRLLHTSFIQHSPSGRYLIHELMRQYGAAKLEASHENDIIGEKHAQYFAELITPLGQKSWEDMDQELLDRINADYENIHTAWQFYLERKNIAGLQQFLDGLWLFFDHLTRSVEAVILFESALDLFQDAGDEAQLLSAQLLARLGWFTGAIGLRQKAHFMLEEALPILQAYNATNDILLAYLGLAAGLGFLGRNQEALTENAKAIDLAYETGATRWQKILENQHAGYFVNMGRYAEALAWMESISEANRFPSTMGRILSHLGEYAQAEEYLLQLMHQPIRHRWSYINNCCSLVELAILSQNIEKAWIYLQRGLQYVGDSSNTWMALHILGFAVDIMIVEKRYPKSVQILALIFHHPATVEFTHKRLETYPDKLKTILDPVKFDAAWDYGKSLELDLLVEEIMAE